MSMRKSYSNRAQTREFVYIPEEVITQILAKLPVKTLLRFRCVCKSWCSIIDSPDFVKLYGNLFDSTKLIALQGLGFGRCWLTIRKSDSRRKIDTVFKSSERYYIEGRCDSLILLSHIYNGVRRMIICNPSIRKSLLLPCSPLSLSGMGDKCIFGFARQTGNYKVMAFALVNDGMRVAVYTLNDRRWVVRDDDGLSTKHRYFADYSNYCSFEGALYWLGINSTSSDRPNRLVSLDFDTEKLTISEMPQSSDDTDSWTDLFLLRESLAVLCVSRVITRIWVLKQEEGGNRGWGLWFSGPSIRDDLKSHLDPSRSISHLARISILYHEGTNGGYIFFGKVAYSIATGKLHLLGKSINHLLHLQTYCESLVLCSRFETEDMTLL